MKRLRSAFVLVLVCLLAPGCSASVAPPASDDGDTPGLSLTDASVEPITLSPDPALEVATVRAARLWSEATGCLVEVGTGGVPIELVDHCWRPDGSDAPGVTSPERDHVRINYRARGDRRDQAVLHEVGHVLGADDIEGDGVMGGGEAIDEAARQAVTCSPAE